MQTNFKISQLVNPEVQHAEQILRACVHCGFCLATCPTYQILGDERDSPRGRIYLIKDILENDKPPDQVATKHIDRCLSCLSCMTTCPSGVDYMHLVDQARAKIEQNVRRKWHDYLFRNLLAYFLVRPLVLRYILWFGTFPSQILKFFPGRLGALGKLATLMTCRTSKINRPQVFPAKGATKKRVALLAGCIQQVVASQINEASVRLLNRLGCEVTVIEDFGCCGAIEYHLGKKEQAKKRMLSNLNSFNEAEKKLGNFDAFIVTASGCGTTLKDYGNIFLNDSEFRDKSHQFSELVFDISEFISHLDFPDVTTKSNTLRIAYHSACSLQHGQGLNDLPKSLLTRAGFNIIDIPESHLCCGSAGTYNLLQPELASKLQMRKTSNIKIVSPDIVVAGNIGCLLQIRGGIDVPVLHTAELLDWATGGPKPKEIPAR